jgi:NAD(P)-dependent dehydrogenase (short-subunit alcohol dehydrogenase family)
MPNANEHVVVVGGTSGIGLSLARAAHALGCKLTLTGRGAERTAETAKSVGSGVLGCHLDLDNAGSIAAALKEGHLDRPPGVAPVVPSGHHREGFQRR